MVQRVLKTILGAVSWEEIEAVMMELFSSIEISQITRHLLNIWYKKH